MMKMVGMMIMMVMMKNYQKHTKIMTFETKMIDFRDNYVVQTNFVKGNPPFGQ